jgi:hypothetical protein
MSQTSALYRFSGTKGSCTGGLEGSFNSFWKEAQTAKGRLFRVTVFGVVVAIIL